MNDERNWNAFASRQAAPSPGLLAGVLSTGIYCRFGCPARTPRRENVRFFTSASSARDAGLRACLRCKPDETPDADLVARAHRLLERCGLMPLPQLAHQLGVGVRALRSAFDRALGLTPARYAEARRIKALQAHLPDAASVTDAIYAAGFAGPRRVYELGDALLGMTPVRFRMGGAGERIGFAVASCRLGVLLVAATQRGICQTAIGPGAADLERLLRARFHKAQVMLAPDLADLVDIIIAHIEARAPLPDLPFDIQATAFEARVWQALKGIPAGAALPYGELARQIGMPAAARAVGRACGANPVAPLIPCHRAVAGNGALTGYRWGLDVKRALLRGEGVELDDGQERVTHGVHQSDDPQGA